MCRIERAGNKQFSLCKSNAGVPRCVENRCLSRCVHLFYSSYQILSQIAILCRISEIFELQSIVSKQLLETWSQSLSLTADEWSLRSYKGYRVSWHNRSMKTGYFNSIILFFTRFTTLHTRESASSFLLNVFEYWNVSNKVSTITTDNASDMCAGIKLLNKTLPCEKRTYRELEVFHVRYIAHLINLGDKQCLQLACIEILTICQFLSLLRSSVRHDDLFRTGAAQVQL